MTATCRSSPMCEKCLRTEAGRKAAQARNSAQSYALSLADIPDSAQRREARRMVEKARDMVKQIHEAVVAGRMQLDRVPHTDIRLRGELYDGSLFDGFYSPLLQQAHIWHEGVISPARREAVYNEIECECHICKPRTEGCAYCEAIREDRSLLLIAAYVKNGKPDTRPRQPMNLAAVEKYMRHPPRVDYYTTGVLGENGELRADQLAFSAADHFNYFLDDGRTPDELLKIADRIAEEVADGELMEYQP